MMRYCTGLVVIEEVLEPKCPWFKTPESKFNLARYTYSYIDIPENCSRSFHKFIRS